MTWQIRYSEISKGIDKLREKRQAEQVSYANGGALALIETKKAALKASNPELYAQYYPQRQEPDWQKLLKL